MARFSDVFRKRQAQLEALAELRAPSRSIASIIEASSERKGLDTKDVAELIVWGRDPHCREEIRAGAREARERAVSRAIEFIIPIYLTSFCQNDCLYCGYRKSNPLAERIRLSLDDFGRQLDVVLGWGYCQIELVLSDDPELDSIELLPYIKLTRKKLDGAGGGVEVLCAPVYEPDDYRRLREAGLDWVVEWQETYHQPHFERWHFLDSPKRHYEQRLDLWDHTNAGGLKQIGMSVLLGLYDWRFDVLAVVEHAAYLRQAYALKPHAIGIPRLKPARGVLASQKASRFSVCDEDYRFIVSLYHLAFPHSRLFFNTREAYDLNLSMVEGWDLFTVDCETLPGGYLRPHPPGQFSTHSYPPRQEVVRVLEQRGFSTRYLEEEAEAALGGESTMAAGVTHQESAPAEFDFEQWTRLRASLPVAGRLRGEAVRALDHAHRRVPDDGGGPARLPEGIRSHCH